MVGYDGFDASLSYKEIRAIRCLFLSVYIKENVSHVFLRSVLWAGFL